MGKLTDVQLRNWIKAGKPLAIADGEGLTFTLSAKGTAAWTLRYRIAGKPKELTLGLTVKSTGTLRNQDVSGRRSIPAR